MAQHDAHFSEFQPHTLLKHRILDSYLVAWAMKLLMSGRAGDRLTIVDAFAGRGQDDAGNSGSPVIAARKAAEAVAAVKKRKPETDPRIRVIAIEKTASSFKHLEQTLEPFSRQTAGDVTPLHGELVNHINDIVAETSDQPTFYFLDPWGIKGLDASTYAKALAGPKNEIFALFSDLGAVRLHGLVTAERADPSNKIAAILTAPSLFPDEDERRVAAAEAEAAKTNKALDASIPASREYLTRALGTASWVDELASTPAQRRADKFIELFRQSLLDAGARFVLAIPMRNDEGHRIYSLVHASKSPAGFITMKECVSTGLRQASLNDSVTARIRADLSIDVDRMVQSLQQTFAGLSIPWAAKRNGLQVLLLKGTLLFHFQVPELKAALKRAGILKKIDRKDVCVFPPIESSRIVPQ